MLTCPVCHLVLRLEGNTYRCEHGHAFDRAREGYVHLLPVGHGRSGITGDTKEMARARQRFLDAGHYVPLSRHLAAEVARHLRQAAASTGDSPSTRESASTGQDRASARARSPAKAGRSRAPPRGVCRQ